MKACLDVFCVCLDKLHTLNRLNNLINKKFKGNLALLLFLTCFCYSLEGTSCSWYQYTNMFDWTLKAASYLWAIHYS